MCRPVTVSYRGRVPGRVVCVCVCVVSNPRVDHTVASAADLGGDEVFFVNNNKRGCRLQMHEAR